MPFISKKSFEELQRAGNMMSNLCFNLSQRKGQDAAGEMKSSQEAWDKAKRAIRQEFEERTKQR